MTKKIHVVFIVPIVVLIIALCGFYAISVYRDSRILAGYLTYQSKDPRLTLTFKYPKEWKPSETQGQDQVFSAVQLLGPADKLLEFSPAFAVSVKPADKQNSTNPMDRYLMQATRFNHFKVVSSKSLNTAGQRVRRVRYQYLLRLPLFKAGAREALMKEEVLFLFHKNKLYRMTFSGTAIQFDKYFPIFCRMMKTFKFTD